MNQAKSINSMIVGDLAARQLDAMPEYRVQMRLLAVSKCAEYPARDVAAFFAVSPSTVRRWLNAYRRGGVEALENRPRGHRRAKLGPAELQVIGRWLRRAADANGNPKHWTLSELQVAVREQFDVEISLMPLWRYIHQHGWRRYLPHGQSEYALGQQRKST